MIENKKQDRYRKEKERLSLIINMKTASDKDIIEYLSKEIEQYRNKIARMEEDILENKTPNQIRKLYGLNERTIQSNEMTLEVEDETVDKDIIEIISTTMYAEGKPIQTTMEYKYDNKDDKEDEIEGSTCPPIEPRVRDYL